jgi:hypothetical protein
MSKKQIGSNGTVAILEQPETADLAKLTLDDSALDSIANETALQVNTSEEDEQPAPDSEQAVLSKVQSFAQVFQGDPLSVDYDDFGSCAKETTDPKNGAVLYVNLGVKGHNLQVAERNLAPSSYDRAAVSKKLAMAARLHGVSESMNRPHEWIAMFWVAKLDRSVPGEPGKPRTFRGDAIPADWFGGNISYGVLRVFSAYIKRVSKDDELDVWDFAEGFEASVRDLLGRLRQGTLSGAQAEALLKHRKQVLKQEKDRAKFAGLTEAEINSIKEAEKNVGLRQRLNKLGEMAAEVQMYAAKELKKDKAALREFLVNSQIIEPPPPPPPQMMTMKAMAQAMTPGHAKELVQTLMGLYVTDPSRLLVLKALIGACSQAVQQMKSASEESQRNVA